MGTSGHRVAVSPGGGLLQWAWPHGCLWNKHECKIASPRLPPYSGMDTAAACLERVPT
jgi:hypothetical protein